MGQNTKYWKSVDELTESSEYKQVKENEFAEGLPGEVLGLANTEDLNGTNRRDFLKFLGFGIGVAALASCETPVNKTIPYVIKPEEITPGVANWYASTFADGYDYCSILVKTREGRPIKIEGNPLSSITRGGVNARVQGSVLSLYDNARLKGAMAAGTDASWSDVDAGIAKGLDKAAADGKTIAILSSTILSTTTKNVIADFAVKYPTAKHVTYDAISSYAIAKAHLITHGKKMIPTYNFAKAKVIVSFGADFLVNWLSPVEFSKQYSQNRKVSKEKKEMSKHVHFESNLSLTGSNADYRFPLKPSQVGGAITQLYNAVTGGSLTAGNKTDDASIKKVADWLNANKGKALVVCGMNDVNAQQIVNEINKAIGAYGSTINTDTPSNYRQGDDEALKTLVDDMKAGNVGALICYNCNPVYNTSKALDFAGAMGKVGTKVSFSSMLDETAKVCDFVAPDHHYLESWSDANPRQGHHSLGQPAIAPLFKTRSAQESLLSWSGNNTDYHTYLKKHWETNVYPMVSSISDFTSFWNKALHDGVHEFTPGGILVPDEKVEPKVVPLDKSKSDTTEPVASSLEDAVKALSAVKGGDYEITLYEKSAVGDGSSTSNNPWLIEFPDPVSKVTWGNYITMNPEEMLAKGLGILARQDRIGDKVTLTVGGITIENIPVFPQPGQTKGTIGLAVGYGRTGGKIHGFTDGFNAYPMVQWVNGTAQYTASGATVSDSTGKHEFACTQQQHTMMGRKIVNETSLKTYVEKPVVEWNVPTLIPTINTEGGHDKKTPDEVTLWDEHPKHGHFWSMAIDLNSCTGCGACVIACHAENNVPVVGKDQVARTRDMHWLRIDRYFSSPMSKSKAKDDKLGKVQMYLEMEAPHFENPKVVFQPMMCQHCDNAPCETVCPVLATNHSAEGLNMMTYNRCVGTRYCANNCPFKVRRFNWYNYTGLERFRDVNPTFGENGGNELGRMVLNPDVVVRSRGVMEKCSMCVQRIQGGKLEAKKAGRKVIDGEIQTACSQSCPTNAITFGDLHDPESAVAKAYADERMYKVLDDLGIQPTVFYLTKVRNDEGEVLI